MHELQSLDASLFLFVNQHAPAAIGRAGLVVTQLASAWAVALWIVAVALVARIRRESGALRVAVSAAVCIAVVQALKHVVERPRPWQVLAGVHVTGPHEATFGFPSQHTALACALATAIALLWPRAGRVAWALALVVGLSRVVVGMHYPGDVLAGAIVGTASAAMVALAWPRADGVLGRRVVIS